MGGSGNSIGGYWKFHSSDDGVRTVVLVGRTGNGKIATGNSILGRKAFKSMRSLEGVTSTSELETTVLENGQVINVIDTPGLFDITLEPEFIGNEILRCIGMAKDGIHAVLLVFSIKNRLTVEEAAAIQALQRCFGDKIVKHIILVFTAGDELEEDEITFDDFLGRSESIKEILETCGNRYVLFDNQTNDAAKKAEQLQQLLSLVDKVVVENGGKPYSDKKGVTKLCDLAAKVNFKKDKSELEMQMDESYDEYVKLITEMECILYNICRNFLFKMLVFCRDL